MVKFNVIEEDSSTNARLGILEINGKEVKTPVLWLGCLLKSKPHPWDHFKVETVLVNAYEIIEKRMSIDSIHEYLNVNGIVMMDSGGFQLMKKNIPVTPELLLDIYKRAEPDIGVVLDHPFNPMDLESRFERWKNTISNTEFMLENSHNIALMPVIHGYTIDDVKKACKEIKEITYPKMVGIGSLVPIVRYMKTSVLSELNGINTIEFMAKVISIVREEFPDTFLHVFGVGSVSTMHLMFSLGVDSVDSMSWRMKAAYGALQLPSIGDRFISPKNGRRKFKEYKLLKECNCPICNGKSLKERKNALDNSKQGTFYKRAIHNAFVFKCEEKAFHNAFEESFLKDFITKRLKKTRYFKVLKNFTSEEEPSSF
jgi:tRNA-guanine family transglycosylase